MPQADMPLLSGGGGGAALLAAVVTSVLLLDGSVFSVLLLLLFGALVGSVGPATGAGVVALVAVETGLSVGGNVTAPVDPVSATLNSLHTDGSMYVAV